MSYRNTNNKIPYKLIFGFIFLLLISTTLCSSGALAASSSLTQRGLEKGLTVDLLNQDPDPVKPGDIFEIRLAVRNSGYEDMKDCILTIENEYPFKAVPGETLSQNLGTLGRNSEDDESKVVKFKLRIDTDVNEGKYPLSLRLSARGSKNKFSITKDVYIDIDSESNAEIEYISLEKLVPGKKTNLVFGIKNVGNSPLENAMFSWECSKDVILPVGSSNVKHINLIGIDETANVTFEVLTNVNTVPGLYKLDMVLTYDDIEELKTITEAGTLENQKRKEIKSKAGIYIGGTTDFDVSYMERNPFGAYTFSVSNIGNNKANSVKITIPLQENWTVQDGSKSVVLGNLQKGDYTIADFNIKPAAYGEEFPLKFEIHYTSSDGQRQVDEKVISLYAMEYTAPAETPGMETSSASSSASSFPYKYVLLVLVGITGIVAYKKFYKKRKMNE
ncbi:MAG: COG1361 S-layer family protein [Methanosarcinaceae archaeon]|nr:COG1361 S-layer family protein [Methanosarcinaceae archaeon]